MSFTCRYEGCFAMSLFQCSCPNIMRFCEMHIYQHQRISKCKAVCIEEELSATKKKIIEIKAVLRTKKKELIKTSSEMMIEINKAMNFGLKIIRNSKKIIDDTIESLDMQKATKTIEEIFPKQENNEKALISIRSLLNVSNFNCNNHLAMLKEKTIEEKKQYFFDNNFEEFSNFNNRQEFEIDHIQISDDNNYAFLCDYYLDSNL